jgi:hypothetical protein
LTQADVPGTGTRIRPTGQKEILSVTLTIAPPELQPSTASSALVVLPDDDAVERRRDELAEEPMDYTPIEQGRLAAPDFPEEVEPEDDDYVGPMGY